MSNIYYLHVCIYNSYRSLSYNRIIVICQSKGFENIISESIDHLSLLNCFYNAKIRFVNGKKFIRLELSLLVGLILLSVEIIFFNNFNLVLSFLYPNTYILQVSCNNLSMLIMLQ